ncbi:MAG: hypothetical protein LIP01_02295 [Tannerellaceae bacterium]|nr:hypothetical protein [Tannerellaceae bacterium]
MNLKDYKKEYPDAKKIVMSMTSETISKHNFYKQNELREYLQDIFPGSSILYCNCSGYEITAIFSEDAYEEEKRQLSMIPGTKVIMTGAEGNFPEYKNKEWEVYAGPQWMCGELVVWLTGFSGSYSCKYLRVVSPSIKQQ